MEEASSPTIDLIKKLFSVYYDAELIQMTSLVDKLSGTVEEGSPGDKVNKLTLKQRINFLNKLGGYTSRKLYQGSDG